MWEHCFHSERLSAWCAANAWKLADGACPLLEGSHAWHSVCTFHIQALCTQWLHPLQRPFQAQLHLQEPDLPDKISVLRDDGSGWQVASQPATSPWPSFLLLFILQSGSNEQLGVLVALDLCSVCDITSGIKPCENLSHQTRGCEGRPGSKGRGGWGQDAGH